MEKIVSLYPSKSHFFINVLYVGLGSLFLALLSQCSIPLPFTPIPLTLQTFGVLFLGGMLGSKKAVASILTYISEGAMGFPVFAQGNSGLNIILGPRGGYLLAFILAAYWVGRAVEKKKEKGNLRHFFQAELIILLGGTLWLSFFVGFKNAVMMGFYPFLICGAIKAMGASYTTKWGRKLLKIV